MQIVQINEKDLIDSVMLLREHPIGDGEALSSGQAEKIDRVMELYPHLTDLEFVRENLERWLLP